MSKFEHQSFSSKIPNNPHPRWADMLGIPKASNYGILLATFTADCAEEILFGPDKANELNRPLLKSKLRPLCIALKNGTFVENWIDAIQVDWDWKIISGQKRLYALRHTYSNGEIHPCYESGVKIRCEYGINPELRTISDKVEERRNWDSYYFAEDRKLNKRIHQALNLASKVHFGVSTASLSTQDLKPLFEANPEGFQWACSLQMQKLFDTAFVRLAFAEGYKLNRRKITTFANELLDLNLTSDSQPVPHAKLFRKFMQTGERPDQRVPYQKLVFALSCFFIDTEVPRLSLGTWSKEQMNTLNYPKIDGTIPKIAKPANTEFMPEQMPYRAVVEAAVRLVTKHPRATSDFISRQIRDNKERWFQTVNDFSKWRKTIPQFSWAALAAFRYERGFDADLVMEDTRNTKIINDSAGRIQSIHGGFTSLAARQECLEVLNEVWHRYSR